MIRYVILYFVYLKYKIQWIKKVTFNGYTIIFSFKNSELKVGDKTVVNSHFTSNLLGLYQRSIIIARHGGRINIGKNVGISGSTIYAMFDINIGDNCMIGANCKIIDNDFHPLDPVKRQINKIEDIGKKQISIGRDCFIGMNSIILKGTSIGDNSIVGAGSVVSGTFGDNVVIAGNPAKVIKVIS